MATPGTSAEPPCLRFAELNALFLKAAQLGGKAERKAKDFLGLQASHFLSTEKNWAAENSRGHSGLLALEY